MYQKSIIAIFLFFISFVWTQENPDELKKQIQELKEKIYSLENQVNTYIEKEKQGTSEKPIPEGKKDKEIQYKQENKNLDSRVSDLEKRIEELELTKENQFDVYWKSGFQLVSKDKNYEFNIGFFAFIDFGFVNEGRVVSDAIGDQEDFADFRQLRPYIKGALYDTYYFMFEVDLANDNDVAFRNNYIGIKNLPGNGSFQIGFMNEPFSMEQIMVPVNITFLELSLINTFVPKFQLGMLYQGYSDNERFTYALGVFKAVVDDAPPTVNDSGSFDFTMRFTGLPIYEDEGKYLVHLGAAYSYRNPPNDVIVHNFKPEINQVDNFQQVTFVDEVEYAHLVGIEWATVVQNFSIQAEGLVEIVELKNGDSADLFGYYIQASYIFTGENRKYNKKGGLFVRPQPNTNFLIDNCGTGAIELAARYSHVFLADENTLTGTRQEDITIGLNWYLTNFLRLEANYIFAKIHDFELNGDGKDSFSHLLAFRVRVTF